MDSHGRPLFPLRRRDTRDVRDMHEDELRNGDDRRSRGGDRLSRSGGDRRSRDGDGRSRGEAERHRARDRHDEPGDRRSRGNGDRHSRGEEDRSSRRDSYDDRRDRREPVLVRRPGGGQPELGRSNSRTRKVSTGERLQQFLNLDGSSAVDTGRSRPVAREERPSTRQHRSKSRDAAGKPGPQQVLDFLDQSASARPPPPAQPVRRASVYGPPPVVATSRRAPAYAPPPAAELPRRAPANAPPPSFALPRRAPTFAPQPAAAAMPRTSPGRPDDYDQLADRLQGTRLGEPSRPPPAPRAQPGATSRRHSVSFNDVNEMIVPPPAPSSSGASGSPAPLKRRPTGQTGRAPRQPAKISAVPMAAPAPPVPTFEVYLEPYWSKSRAIHVGSIIVRCLSKFNRPESRIGCRRTSDSAGFMVEFEGPSFKVKSPGYLVCRVQASAVGAVAGMMDTMVSNAMISARRNVSWIDPNTNRRETSMEDGSASEVARAMDSWMVSGRLPPGVSAVVPVSTFSAGVPHLMAPAPRK